MKSLCLTMLAVATVLGSSAFGNTAQCNGATVSLQDRRHGSINGVPLHVVTLKNTVYVGDSALQPGTHVLGDGTGRTFVFQEGINGSIVLVLDDDKFAVPVEYWNCNGLL